MEVDIVIVEVLSLYGSLLALDIELRGQLLQEVIPREELRRYCLRIAQQSTYD